MEYVLKDIKATCTWNYFKIYIDLDDRCMENDLFLKVLQLEKKS